MYYVRSNVKRELEEKQNTDKAEHPSQELFDNLSAAGKQDFKNNFGPDSLATFGMNQWIKNWRPKQTDSERDVTDSSEQKQHRAMYDRSSTNPNNLISYLTYGSVSNEIE